MDSSWLTLLDFHGASTAYVYTSLLYSLFPVVKKEKEKGPVYYTRNFAHKPSQFTLDFGNQADT